MIDTIEIIKSDSITFFEKVILYSRYYFYKTLYYISDFLLIRFKNLRSYSGTKLNKIIVEILDR